MRSKRNSLVSDITFLDWDSSFFGRKIGRIHITRQSLNSLTSILENARRQQYDLVYAFSSTRLSLSQDVLQRYNGRHVDHKITYRQKLTGGYNSCGLSIQTLEATDDRDALYQLAYQSGEYSRYKIDPNFGEPSFKQLYRQWIDNSISGKLADEVFIHKTGHSITGFITIHKTGKTGIIGLLATDTHYRGKGIGTALLNHVRHYLTDSGCTRLDVVTQAGNEQACRFYEKNQFIRKSALNVFHLWL